VELKIAPEPVANFGWNTASQDLQSQIPIPLAPQIEPLAGKSMLNPRQSAAKAPALSPIFSPTFQGNQSVTSDFNGLASLMQPESASTPAAAPALNSVFDQDDDWGEMVSSPITTNPPAFPPSNGLRHKKSQSLVGSNHDLVMPAVAKNPHFPSPLSRPGHKPTSSLDRLTVSKTRTSAILNTEPSSLDIFDEISTTPPVSHATEPQPTLQTTAIPVTNGNADPWASADFSFFDTPTPTTKPAPPRTARPIPRSIPPKSTPPKSVAFATKPIPPPAQRGNGKSKSEIEQDRIVAGIVKGLPDLSYMLRK
jgi:hypothetical protein